MITNYKFNSSRVLDTTSLNSNNFRVLFYKKLLSMVAITLVIIISFGTYSSLADNTLHSLNYLVNKKSHLCLDIKNDLIKNNTPIDLMTCNHTDAQNWLINLGMIKHSSYCLTITNNYKSVDKVVLYKCTNAPNQVFLPTGGGFINPNSGLCLSQVNNSPALSKCLVNYNSTQNWLYYNLHNNKITLRNSLNCMVALSLNEKLACQAMLAWDNWNQKNSNHFKLLSMYTDNNAYEEWCADFVSYIYHISGHSFSNGERNGWDEYNANYIKYQGFNLHMANSSYVPQPGDVAFFNYPGGHVEMVVVGGKHPTFVYGDSATIDSQTGNGNMATNNILVDGNKGQVVYYLSPN